MTYQIFSVLLCFIALLALLLTAKLLVSKTWFLGFLRGAMGLVFLALALSLGLLAKDISSYKSSTTHQSIATLSFHKKEANNYQVEIQETSGVTYNTDIEGQQWQMNVRMIKWPPLLSAIGLGAGYRVDDISGRFIELQLDNMVGHQPPHKLYPDNCLDIWELLEKKPANFSAVSAYTATPGFVPMADGAIYDVVFAGQSLTVNPMNEAAKSALKIW